MSDKKRIDEKAAEEFDEELPEGPGDDEFDPDAVGEDDDSSDPKGDNEDNEADEDNEDDEAGPKPAAGSEDDEDEPDPGDVEADLDEILRDRIAANDDDDEEEEGEGGVTLIPASGDVEGRRESEIHCPNCFLLVTTDTVTNTGECPHCGGPFP